VYLRNVSTGECLWVFELRVTSIARLAVNDRLVTASCLHKVAGVWDLESRWFRVTLLLQKTLFLFSEPLSTLTKHEWPIGHAKIDGKSIATGASDGSIGL
jgi:hypothetical protein